MGASVKIMLSYDYCHFEICKSTDENITDAEINKMRKDAQRLADEAVRQYVIAKSNAAKRNDGMFQMQNFETTCKRILLKPEGDRTINEIAMLKEYQDEKWREKFEYGYDYDDEDEREF